MFMRRSSKAAIIMTQLNIAILTHNALEYTQKCLASIARHTPAGHRVFIVDNASTDGSGAWLSAQRGENLHIVLSPSNLGVPRGRNLLICEVLPNAPDDAFIIFLDNDVEIHEDWYKPYLELFWRHASVGIAGATGHEIIVHQDRRELLPAPEGDPAPVDVVSGFCFWARIGTVCAVGLFDENLGLFWHEDDDYCIRAISQGYDVFAVPGTALVHYGHKSCAEGDIPHDGSSENQLYLANKWRSLGLVDADGRIIHNGR
jgi:GT2 family glycosyltransferase